MKCINTKCYFNGSLKRHSRIGFEDNSDYTVPKSDCRKFDENEISECVCFKRERGIQENLQWFAGNGKKSQQEADILIEEMKEALCLISGLQQPGRPESERIAREQEEHDKELQQRLDKITAHIYESLTGEKL